MLKESDLLILNHIRDNSRQSLVKISKKTNMPVSTIFDKLSKLENGIISRHVSLLDFSKLGYGLMVNFSIKTRNKEKTKDFLLNYPNVNSLYRVSPSFDFYIECIFKDLKDLGKFKEKFSNVGINDFEENFIVDEIKREEFFFKQI
jgi:DNA-binding Lrp family transcriptional regulator